MPAKLVISVVLALSVAGCDAYPKDPAGTTEHIRQTGTLRTGLVATAEQDYADARAFAGRLAGRLGAKPEFEIGAAAELMRRLDDGDLDLVVGRFAKKTPWKERAAFSAPVGERQPSGKDDPVLRGAVRTGENRWLMFIAHAMEG